jgi:hypothetical protein
MGRTGNVFRSLVGTITGETEKAVRFQIDVTMGKCEEAIMKVEWFPRSQLGSVHKTNTLGADVIMASEWILGQKGWLDFAGAVGYNPTISKVVAQQVVPITPKLSDKLTTPPVRSFSDMDDDIPF